MFTKNCFQHADIKSLLVQQVSFMKQMRVEQLFAKGKHMVIYMSPETAVNDELGYYLWNKEGELTRNADKFVMGWWTWAFLSQTSLWNLYQKEKHF